jgi:hypothetical protein
MHPLVEELMRTASTNPKGPFWQASDIACIKTYLQEAFTRGYGINPISIKAYACKLEWDNRNQDEIFKLATNLCAGKTIRIKNKKNYDLQKVNKLEQKHSKTPKC